MADPSEFDEYAIFIGDEIHHIGAETFFDAGLNHVRNAVHRYGLTADDDRADGGTIMIEAAAGPVIYDYPAWLAIEENYLARPTFITYEIKRTEGTYSIWEGEGSQRRLKETRRSEPTQTTNDSRAYKNWILGNDYLNRFVAGLARGFAADSQSVLVLVDEIEHGQKICALLGEEFRDYGFAVGGGKNNNTLLKAFNGRALKIIVATSTWGEGTDTIPVDVLINLQGGMRPKQAIGRALRNDPGDDGVPQKPNALVIDFDVVENETLHRHYSSRADVAAEYRCGVPVITGEV
jgi:superfamily II DNA or RNA helicase